MLQKQKNFWIPKYSALLYIVKQKFHQPQNQANKMYKNIFFPTTTTKAQRFKADYFLNAMKKESFGQRLARLRKARGYTQVQLAQKVGIIQVLVSDYEHDKLRPYHDMIVKFARALEVSTDELLGVNPPKQTGGDLSLRIVRRMKKIETLPSPQQKTLLKTIDTFLKGAAKWYRNDSFYRRCDFALAVMGANLHNTGQH